MKSKYIIALVVILIILVFAIAIVTLTKKTDLKSKCCAECFEGFQPQLATTPYCVDKTKMSTECIDYLGIKDLQGVSTAESYSNKCK